MAINHKMIIDRMVYNKDRTEQTEIYYGINRNNIEDIFSYNYDENDNSVFGAKAVAVENFKKEIDICFFSQGKGRTGNNVHHRDVFANMVEYFLDTPEFKSYEKLLAVIAEIQPLEGAELEEAIRKLLIPSQNSADFAQKFSDEVVKSEIWNEVFIPLLEVKENFEEFAGLVKQRSNKRLEECEMFQSVFFAQGYQFSARKNGTDMVVISAQMDSSITSIHLRYPDNAKTEIYKRMNREIISRISPELKKFKNIKTPRDLSHDRAGNKQ